MVTWICLKLQRTSGVYREPRSGSRYNARISKWLLQSHVTILKQALCKFSRKLCGSDFVRLNNQNRSFLPIDEKENHFGRQMALFSQSTIGTKQFPNFIFLWFFCLIFKKNQFSLIKNDRWWFHSCKNNIWHDSMVEKSVETMDSS